MDKRKILSRILAAVLLGMMVLSVAATLLIYLYNAR